MDIFLKSFLVVLVTIIMVPSLVYADLVPCDGPDCDLCQLVVLLNNVKDFILFNLASPLAVVAFMVAGIMFLTGGDDPGKLKKAKDIFRFTVIGLIIAFGAWVIINTIFNYLVQDEFKVWTEVEECQLF